MIGEVYDWLGFDAIDDAAFRDLVIARIVEPTSKLDSLRVLDDLGAELVCYKTIDRHVRKIQADGYRDVIARKCFAYATDCGGLSLLLYDVMTWRRCISRPNPKTTCAKSGTPKNAESIHKSSSGC